MITPISLVNTCALPWVWIFFFLWWELVKSILLKLLHLYIVNSCPSLVEGCWDGDGTLIPGRQSWLWWPENALSLRNESAGSQGRLAFTEVQSEGKWGVDTWGPMPCVPCSECWLTWWSVLNLKWHWSPGYAGAQLLPLHPYMRVAGNLDTSHGGGRPLCMCGRNNGIIFHTKGVSLRFIIAQKPTDVLTIYKEMQK